jgi:hypothetical protein
VWPAESKDVLSEESISIDNSPAKDNAFTVVTKCRKPGFLEETGLLNHFVRG